jgi:hypothetical protein
LIDETKPISIKSLKTIEIDVDERPDGAWSLLLTLKDIDFLGLFSQLCEDLIYSSKSLPKSSSASTFVSRRLLSWKRMMEEGKKKTGTKLCARGKSAAKSKFKVYPSAYANGYAVQVCKGRMPGLDGKKKCSPPYC